jgi:hypothetical protein
MNSGGDITRRQFIMRAFAGEQRPWPSDARAVESGSVLVFTVAVAVVAIPRRSLRQSTRSNASITFIVFNIRGSSAARRPKRTNANESG